MQYLLWPLEAGSISEAPPIKTHVVHEKYKEAQSFFIISQL